MKNRVENKFFKYMEKATDVCISLSVVAIIVVILLQVCARYLSISVAWTEEVSRYLFLWMMFIGISVSVRRAEAARITVFLNIMPKIVQKISTYFYFVLCFAFYIFMLYTGIILVLQQISINELGTVIKIPMWIIGIVFPLAGLLGVLNLVACLMYDLSNVKIEKENAQ